MAKSKVLVAIDRSKSYRLFLTITTDMVEEARKTHHTTPLATAALGRLLTGTGLMTMDLKSETARMSVVMQGDGLAKEIVTTAKGDGIIKGYIANPDVELPLKNGKLDVGGAIGVGELTVIKDVGVGEPYVGNIALVSGEVADDLTAYYYISEQQNTSIALGVKVGTHLNVLAAGGMFIQMLPGMQEEAIDELEKMLKTIKPMTTNIEEVMLQSNGLTEESILEKLMNHIFDGVAEDYKPEILEYKSIELKCDCSKEKFANALMTIGKKDLQEILAEDGQAEIKCDFCESVYLFDEDDLQKIIDRI